MSPLPTSLTLPTPPCYLNDLFAPFPTSLCHSPPLPSLLASSLLLCFCYHRHLPHTHIPKKTIFLLAVASTSLLSPSPPRQPPLSPPPTVTAATITTTAYCDFSEFLLVLTRDIFGAPNTGEVVQRLNQTVGNKLFSLKIFSTEDIFSWKMFFFLIKKWSF